MRDAAYSDAPPLYASEGAKRTGHPRVRTLPPSVASGSAGVFVPWDFAVGQECFQDSDTGFDFRDMNV